MYRSAWDTRPAAAIAAIAVVVTVVAGCSHAAPTAEPIVSSRAAGVRARQVGLAEAQSGARKPAPATVQAGLADAQRGPRKPIEPAKTAPEDAPRGPLEQQPEVAAAPAEQVYRAPAPMYQAPAPVYRPPAPEAPAAPVAPAPASAPPGQQLLFPVVPVPPVPQVPEVRGLQIVPR